MKKALTFLGLVLVTVMSGQAQNLEGQVTTQDNKITNLSVSVTVDSAEEVESTFKVKDIEKILEEVEADEELSFEINCNGAQIAKGVTRKVSYRVTGNSSDKKEFLERIQKIRKAALTFYANK